ncbi:MAG TPA: hypothetical protein DDX99_02870 [Desulfofustis sp.]|jgi:DNA-binding transcriptional MerR regulator|nr:hypothetical protein [Desulfofustis sp.]
MILNRSIFHHTLVPLIALTILMVPSIRVLAEQSAAEKVYSGETFENVLKDLSSLSGYQIEVPEDLLSIKVYGNFSVDEVDHFLSRVLRDYNHSFYVNETQNTMIVRVFGEKLGDSVLVVGETGGKKIDIFTGLPKEEVARMHEERRQRLAEPGAIDAFTGLPVAEVQEMLREHQKKYSDPESIDVFTGLTRKKIDRLHAKKAEELKKPEAIDHFSGLTIVEVDELHAKWREARKDPNYIDPFTGLTISELEEIYRQAR